MQHRPIHREPVPVDSTQLPKLLDASLPEFEEDARLHPLLKAVMGCSSAHTTRFGPTLAHSHPVREARRRWHPHSRDQTLVGVLPRNDAYSHAPKASVATPPITHLKCGIPSSCGYSGSALVLVSWLLVCSYLLCYQVIRIGTKSEKCGIKSQINWDCTSGEKRNEQRVPTPHERRI